MTKVLCVGIATLDYVYAVEGIPRRGEKYRAHDLVIVGGRHGGDRCARDRTPRCRRHAGDAPRG